MNMPPDEQRSVDRVRSCNDLLELAVSSDSHIEYLKEATRILLGLFGCATVRVVIVDHGQRIRSTAVRGETGPVDLDESGQVRSRPAELIWATHPRLEEVCREVTSDRADRIEHTHRKIEFFTPAAHGAYYCNDAGQLRAAGGIPATEERLGIALSGDTGALALLPIAAGGRRIGVIELEARQADRFSSPLVERLYEAVRTLGIGWQQLRQRIDIRERVKELSCMYGFARLGAQQDLPLSELYGETVKLLPPAWLYPEITTGRIKIDGRSYTTDRFNETVQSLKADIVIDGATRGFIEVGYIKHMPELDEGPFLTEERHLIDTLARELCFIIEQREYREERLRLREQLRHADRMAAIGQFASGMVHELNEPLTSILGYAQLVTRDTELTDQGRDDLGKIVTSAMQARDILGKLSTFTGEIAPAKTTFDLNELIQDGFNALESRFSRTGIELRCDLGPDLPALSADRSQIMQALTNVVVNAVQAMPDGGLLTLSTARDGDHLLIMVEDTGVGIPEESREKIFNPFFTTKDVNEGVGLGLAVAHGIVVSHNGSIEVASRVGQGSRFTIRLPIDEPVTPP